MTAVFSQLNDRAQHLLKVLIEQYIRSGQPVASTLLASQSGLSLSSATIRNVMASLEKLGLIHAPHTSSGRIPTAQGYRVFVDSLVNVETLDAETLHTVESQIDHANNSTELIQAASNLVSGLTQYAGIVTVPQRDSVGIRHIEFIHLSSTQLIAVLVFTDGQIQNKLLTVEQAPNSQKLQSASNYLNERLTGQNLEQIKLLLIREMREVCDDVDQTMRWAVDLAEKTFQEVETESDSDVFMTGESNLVHCNDLTDRAKLSDLFHAFEEKRQLINLLNTAVNAKGIQIFIGSESGYHAFDDCSLVTSNYFMEDGSVGVLGVVGPTRMPYERVIPVVDITARLLSASFGAKVG
ncbi:MAG: heat-inducible transcription repressor HrcA [Thiotrichaceae bacterium]|nr:heat-inducible transcription repressor HrcA [Thiotrichaceae bacterium]